MSGPDAASAKSSVGTAGNPAAFNPKTVLGMVLFGALAFFAMLYFIGSGNTGGDTNDGQAHGAGKGLNGYAALAALLGGEGFDVSLARSPSAHENEGLLILTPPPYSDAEEVSAIINDRRYVGPTMVILPKWNAYQIPPFLGSEAEEGWVKLVGTSVPDWPKDLVPPFALNVQGSEPGNTAKAGWRGMGLAGNLPEPQFQSDTGNTLVPLIVGDDETVLAGYADDDGYYPVMAEAAQIDPGNADYLDQGKWPVIFVIEPDLVNNYGFADRTRAQLALELVSHSMQRDNLPVTFDLTLNGLGQSQNLLTLAFTPPFLAATLCLILALIVVGWRAFRRFGPPVTEGRSIAFGKARLVTNSAGFIQRSRRLHLLSHPYADMMRTRLGKALALRHVDDDAIDAALRRRLPDAPAYSQAAINLRNARTPHDILRAAAALKSIERMLNK